jgi:cyclopropane fatty-acyl-phospholipid synthase-like methyltransferase
MFDSICRLARESDYDFRSSAQPADPLAYRFEEWVPYYKTKWAITRVLKPKSILEIGVRFGYSAAAFLNGFPSAEYLGIDLDIDTFGGTSGAIEWAKKITSSFRANFLVEDSQQMERFPGDVYDLIHVDGQQDGDGTYHDMQLAAKQGRYILADGYFWTRQNFAALSEFLYQFREQIEYYGVIPGYAGELLIRVRDSSLARQESNQDAQSANSLALQGTYTSDYYLHDCGGYLQYRQNQGKNLEDVRLIDVAAVAGLKGGGRVLDLGCGRGELSYYFAQEGFEVTAIDYSADAIKLAEKCFDGDEDLKRKVEFICGDVCTVKLSGKYDLAVASDLIEHLSPEELEKLYSRISAHLAHDGFFVLHTFPNRWYYQYEYARKRRVAASVGAYLSPQPRSRYEQLMHINEQSPRIMKKSLHRHFAHVLLWFAKPEDPVSNLLRKFTKQELRATPDLFAVVSQSRVKPEQIAALLQTHPLHDLKLNGLSLAAEQVPGQVHANSDFHVKVTLKNSTKALLNSFMPNPVRISYHWLNSQGSNSIVYDGLRTNLFPALRPGHTRAYLVNVQTPAHPGSYILRMTLVQEFVRWFDDPPFNLMADLSVVVK